MVGVPTLFAGASLGGDDEAAAPPTAIPRGGGAYGLWLAELIVTVCFAFFPDEEPGVACLEFACFCAWMVISSFALADL